jgi:type II secretory pathway component HofQ
LTEPENLVLKILREMRAEMATKADIAKLESNIVDVRSEVKSEMAGLRSEMKSEFANVAADFIEYDKRLRSVDRRLGEQLFTIRRQLLNVELSLVSHGTTLIELDERVTRRAQGALTAHASPQTPRFPGPL